MPITNVDVEFDKWMDELRTLAVRQLGFSYEAAGTLDEKAYREYFDQDYSPESAFSEDMSND